MPKPGALPVALCVGLAFTLSLFYQYGYPETNITYDMLERRKMMQESTEERFLRRRQRVRETCQAGKNKEDVSFSIKTRIYQFWNYNASICTMGKVCTTLNSTNLFKMNTVLHRNLISKSLLLHDQQTLISYITSGWLGNLAFSCAKSERDTRAPDARRQTPCPLQEAVARDR